MWSTREVMIESLLAQVRSLADAALGNVTNERVYDAHSFGRQPELGWTCSSICIHKLNSSASCSCYVSCRLSLSLTLLGPFLWPEGMWLSWFFCTLLFF